MLVSLRLPLPHFLQYVIFQTNPNCYFGCKHPFTTGHLLHANQNPHVSCQRPKPSVSTPSPLIASPCILQQFSSLWPNSLPFFVQKFALYIILFIIATVYDFGGYWCLCLPNKFANFFVINNMMVFNMISSILKIPNFVWFERYFEEIGKHH